MRRSWDIAPRQSTYGDGRFGGTCCSVLQSSAVKFLSPLLSLFCQSTRRYIPVGNYRDAQPVTSSSEGSIRIWEILVRIPVGHRLGWLGFIVVFLSPYSSRRSADQCDAGRCCPYVAVGSASGMAVGRQLQNVTVRVLALMQGLVGKTEGKILGEWEDNIKMGWEGVDVINMAQDRDSWQAAVSLRVP